MADSVNRDESRCRNKFFLPRTTRTKSQLTLLPDVGTDTATNMIKSSNIRYTYGIDSLIAEARSLLNTNLQSSVSSKEILEKMKQLALKILIERLKITNRMTNMVDEEYTKVTSLEKITADLIAIMSDQSNSNSSYSIKIIKNQEELAKNVAQLLDRFDLLAEGVKILTAQVEETKSKLDAIVEKKDSQLNKRKFEPVENDAKDQTKKQKETNQQMKSLKPLEMKRTSSENCFEVMKGDDSNSLIEQSADQQSKICSNEENKPQMISIGVKDCRQTEVISKTDQIRITKDKNSVKVAKSNFTDTEKCDYDRPSTSNNFFCHDQASKSFEIPKKILKDVSHTQHGNKPTKRIEIISKSSIDASSDEKSNQASAKEFEQRLEYFTDDDDDDQYYDYYENYENGY